jgi:hypothetical protein
MPIDRLMKAIQKPLKKELYEIKEQGKLSVREN